MITSIRADTMDRLFSGVWAVRAIAEAIPENDSHFGKALLYLVGNLELDLETLEGVDFDEAQRGEEEQRQ